MPVEPSRYFFDDLFDNLFKNSTSKKISTIEYFFTYAKHFGEISIDTNR